MNTVRNLLNRKGHTIWSIGPDTPVFAALELLAAKNIGALPVIDADGALVGILSERDYARKVVLLGKTSRETPVRDIMTERVITINADSSMSDCLALMTDRRIRHLPVVDGDALVGFISIGDVVKAVIDEQRTTINHLESYITT